MRFLIDKGAFVHGTHFRYPCIHGDEEAIKLLLQYGDPVDSFDPFADHSTLDAFCNACSKGYVRIVELLIERCAQIVNSYSEAYGTPLRAACNARKEELALLVLRKGADPTRSFNTVGFDSETVLEAAVEGGLENLVNTIVEDHSIAPRWNEFVLAVMTGNNRIVQILWDSKKLDKEDLDSALFIARQDGHDAIVLLLSGLGADINHRPKKGRRKSALEVSQRLGYSNVVSVLLEEEADDVSDVQYEDSDGKSRNDIELDEGEELDEDQNSAEDREPE